MEQNTCDIKTNKELFSQCRQEAQSVLSDPFIRQWNKISLEKDSELLSNLGADLKKIAPALKSYQKAASALLLQTSRCENKLSNLEADISLNELSTEEAEKQAKFLSSECAVLLPLRTALSQHSNILIEQSKRIHRKLTFKSLLSLASKEISANRKQKKIFAEGFKAFCLVTDDKQFRQKGMNLQQIEEATEKIEAKFAKLEFPESSSIPPLATTIIRCHIETCRSSLKEIHKFTVLSGMTFRKDIARIKDLERELKELQKQPFAKVLSVLPDKTQKALSCINEFQYKQHVISEIGKITILLRQMQIFYESLRYSYLPHLEKEMSLSNSPLSPQFVAQETSQDFFKGLNGFIRLIRLLYSPSTGIDKLNEKALREKILIALTTCPYYYCAGHKDSSKITIFIEKSIIQYNKPYPYEELFTILKKAINDYGSAIEKDFFHYKAEQRDKKEEKIQLGRLLGKIEASIQSLQAQQADDIKGV